MKQRYGMYLFLINFGQLQSTFTESNHRETISLQIFIFFHFFTHLQFLHTQYLFSAPFKVNKLKEKQSKKRNLTTTFSAPFFQKQGYSYIFNYFFFTFLHILLFSVLDENNRPTETVKRFHLIIDTLPEFKVGFHDLFILEIQQSIQACLLSSKSLRAFTLERHSRDWILFRKSQTIVHRMRCILNGFDKKNPLES